MLERFMQLFVGGDHAHGVWEPESRAMRTEKSEATAADYEKHLSGELGLGLVPVSTTGTCRFGAIDIDIDTIDHEKLFQRVQEHGIPLNVCRSKSGGAHLYVFTRELVRATQLIAALKRWATVLGYPKSELFPKQARVTKNGNLGNWINLPFFHHERTVRYAVGLIEGKPAPLTLAQFLDQAIVWDGQNMGAAPPPDLVQIEQMPPCLASLTRDGLPEGQRNNGLFDFAVFYRKSSPNGWEDKIVQHNQKYVSPPLPNREVQAIIKSIAQRTYQYRCNEEPICSRCDRKTCLQLPYGVGHEPWKDQTSYADLLMTNCRKIMSDPPRYIVEVNGHNIEMVAEELLVFSKFQRRVFELTNQLIFPHKKDHWDKLIIELVDGVKEVEAPPEARRGGMVLDRVQDFLALIDRSTSQEDILRGLPILYNKDRIAFRASDLQKHLRDRYVVVQNDELYQVLYGAGCRHTSVRVKGKIVSAWVFPLSATPRQTEDFTPPEDPTPEDDRI